MNLFVKLASIIFWQQFHLKWNSRKFLEFCQPGHTSKMFCFPSLFSLAKLWRFKTHEQTSYLYFILYLACFFIHIEFFSIWQNIGSVGQQETNNFMGLALHAIYYLSVNDKNRQLAWFRLQDFQFSSLRQNTHAAILEKFRTVVHVVAVQK